MVPINLKAGYKIALILIAQLLLAFSFVLATNAVLNNENNKKEIVSSTNMHSTQIDNTLVSEECIEEPTLDDLSNTEKHYIQYYTEQDVIDIARVLYHECRGVPSVTEQACVAWTILNRVDCYNSTVSSVVRAPNQFAFDEEAPLWDELLNISSDVLDRWNREKNGETNVGRVLPPEYIYFEGRNGHNYFRDNYDGSYNIWDYSLNSPYNN